MWLWVLKVASQRLVRGKSEAGQRLVEAGHIRPQHGGPVATKHKRNHTETSWHDETHSLSLSILLINMNRTELYDILAWSSGSWSQAGQRLVENLMVEGRSGLLGLTHSLFVICQPFPGCFQVFLVRKEFLVYLCALVCEMMQICSSALTLSTSSRFLSFLQAVVIIENTHSVCALLHGMEKM